MPRQARVDVPGLLHHVMARGIEKRPIFTGPDDYSDFQARLEQSHERYPCQILAWALMPNHFHLLIRSGPLGLVPFMRKLMSGYATAYNLRHRRSGHLFGNRYKSIICEEETYLLELVRYIHLNPLRGGLVKSVQELAAFPYCGHGSVLGKKSHPWQAVQEILSHYSTSPTTAQKRYEQFVRDGVGQGKRDDLTGGGLVRSMGGIRNVLQSGRAEDRQAYDSRILGSGPFVQEILKVVDGNPCPQGRLEQNGLTWDDVPQRVADEFGVRKEDLFRKVRTTAVSNAKSLLIHIGVEFFGRTNRDMALMTKMGDGAASRSRQRGASLWASSKAAGSKGIYEAIR